MQVTVTDEADTLYQKLSVLVKGHDRSVLDSYEFFASVAAQELGLALQKVWVHFSLKNAVVKQAKTKNFIWWHTHIDSINVLFAF